MNPSTPRITASVSPVDPRVCAFSLDRSVLSGSALCSSADKARGSPLFENLFALPGVVQVWAAGDRVTVACAEPQPWDMAGRAVAQAIRAALTDGRPLVAETAPLRGDLGERVRDVLNADINPSLAQHGGRAELVEMSAGVARIRLAGGCQGCGAAKMTLSQGVERTLRSRIPELVGVEDATDHAAGERPYYPGAGESPFAH